MFSRRSFVSGALLLPACRFTPVHAQSTDSALSDLLGRMPSLPIANGGDSGRILVYTDIDSYLAVEGFETWSELLGPNGGNVLDLSRIPLDELMHRHIELVWSDLIGFGPDDIDQAATAFGAPDQIRVYRGTFDLDRIASSLNDLEYTATEEGGFALFAAPGGAELDLFNPMQSVTLGALKFIAVTDTTIICARTEDSLQSALQMTGDSMRDLLIDTGLFTALQPLTGFYLFDGRTISADYLELTPEPNAAGLPPATYFAAGVEISSTTTTTQFLIDFGDESVDDAVEIIRDRIEHGISVRTDQPIPTVIGQVTVELLPDSAVVMISGSAPEFAQRWQAMIFGRDLMFIATS